MTAKTIGRQTLLKYCIISVLAILTIFISTFLIFGDPTATTVTLDNALSTLMRDFLDNYLFVGIQTVLIIIEILIIGGLIGELIIKREKKYISCWGTDPFDNVVSIILDMCRDKWNDEFN
jgi:hypothetical protein